MYRVLFVEDELLVRLGIQNSISWENYQMQIAGVAENGEKACQLFHEIKPDVLITDLQMEGMDGVELIRYVREHDKECAIVVISCVNDFETLRKLIPYNINAYVLKASISIDEVCGTLEQVREYLLKIGRMPEESANFSVKTEEKLSRYLCGGGIDYHEPEEVENLNYMFLFRLAETEKDKINMLAMNFIYELVKRQMPGNLLIPLKEKEFCIFCENWNGDLEENIRKINRSIEEFLGIRFENICSKRKERESLKEWFERTYTQEQNKYHDAGSKKTLIQKSVIYIQEHYMEDLSLSDISKVVGLSENYFSHLFKKETGKNYVEYLNEIRLKEVMNDLKNSDDKILVIAQRHGFQNLEYFSRFFKRQTGESPAKWRKMNQ